MKKLIAYINSKVLDEKLSLQTISVITRIIAGILTSKAVAIFIGPVGLALLGNLRSFVSASHTLAIFGMYKGAVRYISKFKDDFVGLSKTLSTIFYTGFFSTIIVSLFCYFNAQWINDTIFPEYNNYTFVIKIFAIILPFYTLNMFSYSIMNGFSKYKTLIIINIIGQILSVSIALFLIYLERLRGALISVAIAESIIFLITLVGIMNRRSLIPYLRVENVSLGFFKKISAYSLMALFTAVLLPLVIISIRSYIIDNVSYKDAGFWEAMTRISNYYLMLVSSMISLYLLPRFSEINDKREFKKEVFSFYKTLIPILVFGMVLIYLLRKYIVLFVFTKEFEPVEDLFLWQLLGDFVKMLSIIIAYQFLAKRMFWHYILTEAFLIITIYFSSIYFIDVYDSVEGAVIAHFVSYAMYFGIILLIFSSSLFGVDNEKV